VEKLESKKAASETKQNRKVPKKKETVQQNRSGVTKKKKFRNQKKKSVGKNTVVSTEKNERSSYCIYCNEQCIDEALEEVWLQCCKCKEWCHETCEPIDNNAENFTCDFCLH